MSVPAALDKTAIDEFMLKEYESIASAHFDSQSGLRQQFRFYLLIAAVPVTVLGLAFKDRPATEIEQMGIFDLPRILVWLFLGIGVLGILMLLSMVHTALDASLYAPTVNGIRHYFVDRAKASGNEIQSYLKMPIDQRQPSYFHLRAFFWQVFLMAIINSLYIALAVQSFWGRGCISTIVGLAGIGTQIAMYWLFAQQRERQEISLPST
jgi:hypothetical protein